MIDPQPLDYQSTDPKQIRRAKKGTLFTNVNGTSSIFRATGLGTLRIVEKGEKPDERADNP